MPATTRAARRSERGCCLSPITVPSARCASGARKAGTKTPRARLEDEGDNPEVSLQKVNKAEQMRQCIAKLSAEHRTIIDLVYYHEKSINEVSEILDIPLNTVKTRMFYARKKLSELLQAAGIDRGWP